MKTIRLTTAQAIVHYLKAQYVERDGRENRFIEGVFGIFGHGNVAGMGQALEEYGEGLRYHQVRNEQAMVLASLAFAKVHNRLKTFACTSSIGPGATNMITGAAAAALNRIPVLLLPGDLFARRLPDVVLQKLEYPMSPDVSVNDCFRPISRFWDRINRPEQILNSLPEALRVLTNQAQTGPVTIALPQDVQAEAYDFPAAFFEKRVIHIPRPAPEACLIAEAAKIIGNSRRPLIIAGGGAIYAEAHEELSDLSLTFGIPVAETNGGKGSLRSDHDLNVGGIGVGGGEAANRLAETADAVICVGTRLSDFTTASRTAFQHPQVKFISLNVGDMDAHKHGALPLVGDAKVGLAMLGSALREKSFHASPSYQEEIASLKEAWDTEVDRAVAAAETGLMHQGQVIGVMNDFLREDDILVAAAGTLPGDLQRLWRAKSPKQYHLEWGYSTMGYEIAGALGAKMADPRREVYALVGDGSYLMMNNEIVTSIQEGLKITIVLLDNHGLQSIRGLQVQAGSPPFGNEFRFRSPASGRLDGDPLPIDFMKNAGSLGAETMCAGNDEELRAALTKARANTKTTFIYVEIDPYRYSASYRSWWDVPVAETSRQSSVNEAYAAYRESRKKQRYFFG